MARKITRAKWETKQGFADGEIQADAVTADLRTQENSLSFWQCGDGTTGEVEKAALALAAGFERVDKLEIVWISEDELRADGQNWAETAGQTPVTDLNNLHVDLSRLDFVRLGKVANRVATAIADRRYRRLSKGCVTNLLASAVRQDRVKLDALEIKVRMEVSKLLEE